MYVRMYAASDVETEVPEYKPGELPPETPPGELYRHTDSPVLVPGDAAVDGTSGHTGFFFDVWEREKVESLYNRAPLQAIEIFPSTGLNYAFKLTFKA